ncbi:MAG: response regulator transcription factor [Alphaproteobacteria bacterium]
MRILVVEDDADLSAALADMLGHASYAVDQAAEAETAEGFTDVYAYDLILLDLGLPGDRDGLTLLKDWRKAGLDTPIIILTARDGWREKVAGMDAGADDYVTKPFHEAELLARVRARLRAPGPVRQSVIELGDVEIDTAQAQVFKAGRAVRLTAFEFRLLNTLAMRPDQVFSRDALVEHMVDGEGEATSNSIEVLVGRIRRKLGRNIVETVHGHGYRAGRPAN